MSEHSKSRRVTDGSHFSLAAQNFNLKGALVLHIFEHEWMICNAF